MSTGAAGIIVTVIAGGGSAIVTAAGGKLLYGALSGAVLHCARVTQLRPASDSMPPLKGRIIAPGWDLERCNRLETLRAVSSGSTCLHNPGSCDLQHSDCHGVDANPPRYFVL